MFDKLFKETRIIRINYEINLRKLYTACTEVMAFRGDKGFDPALL